MNQRGMVYIVSLGIALVVTIAGASLLIRSVSENTLSERFRNQSAALHLAEAGVDQAEHNLQTPPPDPSDPSYTSNPNIASTTTNVTLPTGTFQIDVPPTSLGVQTWQVKAHGVSSLDSAYPRHIEATFQLTPQSAFQGALFGDEKVTIGGNTVTDSYDSRLGDYQDPPSNWGKNGDVGTNGVDPGDITVTGTTLVVNGQIVVGPDADPLTVMQNVDTNFITGGPPAYFAESAPFPMPSVSVPAGCQTTLPPKVGQTITLSSAVGAYCPPGDLVINGGDILTADGPVKVYLSGQLSISGNSTVGVEGSPPSMLFLLASSQGATIETITGTPSFYGAIYAPQSTITIDGTSQVYGSIVAKQITMLGNAQIHYDEALGACDGPNPSQGCGINALYQTTLVSWRETAN